MREEAKHKLAGRYGTAVLCCACLAFVVTVPQQSAHAGPQTAAAREAAEYIIARFGKEAAKDSAEVLAGRIEGMAARYGDEAILAARKVGPRAMELAERAGPRGAEAVRLMAKYGDDAAWALGRKEGMELFTRYGEEAAEAVIRHKGVAEPIIGRFGQAGAKALNNVSAENARRIGMMLDAGELARIGRTEELLGVVGRYGDRAMDFIWKHKGALTVSATLAAFLADPEPFINGVKDIAQYAAQGPTEIAKGIAGRTNWTLVVCLCVAIAAVAWGVKSWLKSRRRRGQEPFSD